MLNLRILSASRNGSNLSSKKFCTWFKVKDIQQQLKIKKLGTIIHGSTILTDGDSLDKIGLQQNCLLLIIPESLHRFEFSNSIKASLMQKRGYGCQECKTKFELWLAVLTDESVMECDHDLKALCIGVKESYSVDSAIKYLANTCPVCFCSYSMDEIYPLQVCDCHICKDCLRRWIAVIARDKDPGEWHCPVNKSHWAVTNRETMENLFSVITLYIETDPSLKQHYEVTQKKINTWRIMLEENFLWCSNKLCTDGFLYTARVSSPEAMCPTCHEITCFDCKNQWYVDESLCHDDMSCHDYNYAIMNQEEPDTASLIKQKGLVCPNCSYRYFEAKGGCLHFSCTKCGFEFCSGCGREFLSSEKCSKCKENRNIKGGHAHCPRNCIYFLRDFKFTDLESLLTRANIDISIPTKIGLTACQVTVTDQQFVDKPCPEKVVKYNLCDNHYKEVLAYHINENHLDPLEISDIDRIKAEIRREYLPKFKTSKFRRDSPQYRNAIIQYVKTKLPLEDLSRK